MHYTLFRTKFKMRILYKSGNEASFWVYNFSMTSSRIEWEPVYPHDRPLLVGFEEIEAVYQVAAVKSLWDVFKK